LYDNLDAAEVYLDVGRISEELYHEEYKFVACLFASIPNFMDYYTQQDATDGGLHCLELLNHIISGFDAVRHLNIGIDIILSLKYKHFYLFLSYLTKIHSQELKR